MYEQENTGRSLDTPFLISNLGLDKKVMYLTISKHHLFQNSFQVDFRDLKEGHDDRKDQLWYFESTSKEKYYRIRHYKSFHLQKDLYITLVKGQLKDQYSIEVLHLHDKQGDQSQLWTFDLGIRNTYAVKASVGQEKFIYILPTEDQNKVRCGEITYEQDDDVENYDDVIRIEQFAFTPQQAYRPSSQTQAAVIQVQHQFVTELKKLSKHLIHFKGKIYCKDSPEYKYKIQQYATSSKPIDQMSPYLIAYPVDQKDIALMLCHANDQKKIVVARSGGHQYSGLSSGGNNTIVLSMDNFSAVTKNDATGLIEVGPCVPLKVLSANLQKFKVSIPHGECPLVNVGGHAQTGGFGHIIHSFGLCLDYVQKFDIVLADGTWRTVERPDPAFVPQNDEDQLRIELFRGVLGGNAGSFGIVTKYYFNSIKDSDHLNSYGFSKIRLYSNELFYQTMRVIKKMTQQIAKDKENGLKGLDIELTVGQHKYFLIGKIPVLLLEGIYSDPDGKTPYSGQFKQILDVFQDRKYLLKGWLVRRINSIVGFEGHLPLSELCGKFVRSPPSVTESGRQFDLPYVKRTNATMTPLRDQFLKEFTEQVGYLANHFNKSLYVVIQMLFGGGGYYQKGQIKANNGLTVTSIPNRDEIYFFVYDIFYDEKEDSNARKKAEQLQDKMQVTVDKYFNTPGVGEKRFFWACFDDFDMRKKEVILMYYDSVEQYQQLQKLKDKVDKGNLFNTLMTVKPTSIPIQGL